MSNDEADIYLKEIELIVDACLVMAKRYADRRGMHIGKANVGRGFSDYQDKVPVYHSQLIEICNRIENLCASVTYRRIKVIRNEGFTHSVEASHKRIKDFPEDWDGNITVQYLLDFGDEAMDLAFEFDSIWNSRFRPNRSQLMEQRRIIDQEFWEKMRTRVGI